MNLFLKEKEIIINSQIPNNNKDYKQRKIKEKIKEKMKVI
jgi:hypothetical protein